MRRLYTIALFLILTNCSKNQVENENCNFLLDINVALTINLNLPEYNQLKFAGNSVYIPNHGNKGVIVAYTGADYLAWDAADPNHPQSECSVLVNSGLSATCGCEDKNEYSLVTGQGLSNGSLVCALRFYRVEPFGDSLRITY